MSPAQKSIVWYFFQKTPDKTAVVCSLCRQQLKYFQSTSNLKQHVIRKHPAEYNAIRLKDESSIVVSADQFYEHEVLTACISLPGNEPNSSIRNENIDTIETEVIVSDLPQNISTEIIPVTTLKKRSSHVPIKKQKQLKLSEPKITTNELTESQRTEIDSSLLKMIVTDFQPLSVVENRGFLEFTKQLNPFYTIPSKQTLTSKLLPETYWDRVNKMKSMLRTVDFVSLSTDMWLSDSNTSYLSVTCHFINNTKIHSQVLGTKEFTSETNNEKNIAENLNSLIQEWGLDEKIVTIVSDNSNNIKNAISEHLNKCHHPCVAQTLNSNMKEVLNENATLKSLISKCKKLVAYFKHSDVAEKILSKCQIQIGQEVIKVKQAVDSRWNSILEMLERLLKIKVSLTLALSSLPMTPNFLDATEWKIIADCIPILKPFESLTMELSEEKYVSMSLIIPLVRGLQLQLDNTEPTTKVGIWLQKNLNDIISSQFGTLEFNAITAKTTFLDPRFKKTAFGLDENSVNAQNWITDEVSSMISSSNTETSPSKLQNEQRMSIWSHFKQKLAETKIKTTPTTTAMHYVRQYLELPHLEISASPLEFWENYKNMMPELYKLHLKYLSVPAVSIPSERVFSKAGQLLNAKRNRLSSNNLNMISFLNSNYSNL